MKLRWFVFGSSLLSAYWNGAATYYRGIYKHLHALGHTVDFAEPDIYGRQQHRDAEETAPYAHTHIYRSREELDALLGRAREADLIVKHSGIGAEDEYLAAAVLAAAASAAAERRPRAIYWDVDAPATLAEVEAAAGHYLRPLLPGYDYVFTYGGGEPVMRRFLALGARNCSPIYNGFDPEAHFRVPTAASWQADAVFIGHRLPDREARVHQFLFAAARLCPARSFLLAGAGWEGAALPANVRYVGHAPTRLHNAINSSAGVALNINRESMARNGYSPPTRIFEAAGAAACVVSDTWPGLEHFFVPGREIWPAADGAAVAAWLERDAEERLRTGRRMLERALAEHTYAQRAAQIEAILQAAAARPAEAA